MTPLSMIGTLAMEYAEQITETYGEDAKVATVAIVAEIFAGDGETFIDTIEYACTDPRRWLQLALLSEAVGQAEERNADRVAEAESPD